VHALVYEPSQGLARKLPINFKDYISDLHHVYDLFDGSSRAHHLSEYGIENSTYLHDIEEVTQDDEGDK